MLLYHAHPLHLRAAELTGLLPLGCRNYATSPSWQRACSKAWQAGICAMQAIELELQKLNAGNPGSVAAPVGVPEPKHEPPVRANVDGGYGMQPGHFQDFQVSQTPHKSQCEKVQHFNPAEMLNF